MSISGRLLAFMTDPSLAACFDPFSHIGSWQHQYHEMEEVPLPQALRRRRLFALYRAHLRRLHRDPKRSATPPPPGQPASRKKAARLT